MPNLREMVDGTGNLALNAFPVAPKNRLKPKDMALIRRQVNRSGPPTHEVMLCKILAMGKDSATVSVLRPQGPPQRAEVKLTQLSPVTESFKRSSIQFSPAYRGRM